MISGDVESSIYLMDIDDTKTVGCNFSGLAPLQRIKICFEHEKSSYNQSVFDNNGSGDFDTNILSVRFYLSEALPIANQPFPSASQPAINLPNELSNDDSTSRTNCTTFRVEEIWANLNEARYITCIWQFRYVDGNGEQVDDYIRKSVCCNFSKFDDETGIQFNGVVDANGDPVEDFYCSTYQGFLYPEFTSLLPNTYTQTAAFIANNGTVSEQNDHSNTNLPSLSTALISDILPVNPINTNDDFRFCINSELLNNDIEYCFATILIQEAPLPTSVDCPCVTLTLAQTLVQQNTQQYNFSTTFTLGTEITAAEVQNIDVFHNGTIIGTSSFTGVNTGTVNINLPISETSSTYTVNITSVTGCNYAFNINMPLSTVSLTESGCVEYCTLSFTSPDPTGSNIFFLTYAGGNLGSDFNGYDDFESQELMLNISDYLTSQGYIYDQVLVGVSLPSGSINDVVITGTNMPLGIIKFNYEDFGDELGVETNCTPNPTTTLCSIQWNGSLTDGLAFIEYSDGTNIGSVAGYTGAQITDLSNDLKAHAQGLGFTVGAALNSQNGNGWVDLISFSNTNIPENYYRIRWAGSNSQEQYGTVSGCVTT